MSRRLLLVTYFYPPEPTAGALRPFALAKYLPRHGWTVDVLTRLRDAPLPDGRLLLAPHEPWMVRLRDAGIRPDRWFHAPPLEHTQRTEIVARPRGLPARVWNLFRLTGWQAITWPDRTIDWYFAARTALRDHLRERPPDVVMSTSPTETAHFVARWAARVSRAAWLADLRDPWSDTQLVVRPRWRRALDLRTERHVLRDAARLTTVTERWAERLRETHVGKPIATIRNGFDPDLFPASLPVERTRFELLHAGAINPSWQAIRPLMRGIRAFLDKNPSVPLRLRLLGETSEFLAREAEAAGIADRVILEPRRTHDESVAAMRTAAVNVLLPWQDPAHPGQLAAKLFEYFGARRPILAIGAAPTEAARLAEETGLGRRASDAGEVTARLEELFASHAAGTDAWTGDEARIREHSHAEMAGRFARELELCRVHG